MKKKNRTIPFILILLTLTMICTVSSPADQETNAEIFKQEAITSKVSFETQNPIGKAYQEAIQTYQKTKDFRKAVEILKKANVDALVTKSPEEVSLTKDQYTIILNDYAYFLYLDKQNDKALPMLSRIIEVNPERTTAYLNRGDIYRDKHKQTKDTEYRDLYIKDYRKYNDQMIKTKESYLVPDRVESELYTLVIRDPPEEKKKRMELERQILNAAKGSRTEEVIRLLEEGTDPNAGGYVAPERYRDNDVVLYQSENYETPLFCAVEKNNIEMAKYLINNGAMVLIKTLQRNTPLHFAACNADLEMVKYLLKRGAYYSFTNNNTLMPVAWSVGCGESKYEVFAYLLALKGGGYINQESLNDMVVDAGKLKDHEKAYRMTRVLFGKFGKKLSKDALGKGYVNAVTADNKKLIDFYKTNKVQMDQNEYIIALIEAKKFKEAREEIDKAKEINGEVFRKLSLIPLYATDRKCEWGGVKYEGTELEDLLIPAMKKYDVNGIVPKQFGWQKDVDYNEDVEGFINQLISFLRKQTNCMDKERVIKIIKLMLSNGLRPGYFNSQFAYIISLNDIEFGAFILQGGVKVKPEVYPSLFYHAKNMEMVRFLEAQGFTLTAEEFKKILENSKRDPELLMGANPQVIEYYQSRAR
jgi:tetratricopeptide (TPR) repeat protein